MITRAEDYDFVIFEDPILIDGGIMPRRMNQSILRGEDKCFLTELDGTIWTVHEGSKKSKTYVDKRIRYRPFKDVIQSFKMYADLEWVMEAPPYLDVGYNKYNVQNQDMVEAFNLHIDESRFKSDEKKFYHGAKVEQQPILDIYNDARLLTTIPDYNNYLRYIELEHSYSHNEWGEEYPIPQTASHTTLMLFNVYRHEWTSSEGSYIAGAWKKEIANGGNLTIPTSMTRMKYATCNKVVVFATYGEWYYLDRGGGTTYVNSDNYACGVVGASTNPSTGEVTIDKDTLIQFTLDTAEHYGFQERTYATGEQYMYLDLNGVYPIWELNDRMKW